MAYTLEQLRRENLTSVKQGTRFALDQNDFLVGSKAERAPIEDFDGSTGSTAVNFGVTNVYTAGASGIKLFTLQAPVPGVRKVLANVGPSTAGIVFDQSGVTFVGGSRTSAGATSIQLVKQNTQVQLLGISTSQWVVMNSLSSGGVSSAYPGITYSATSSS